VDNEVRVGGVVVFVPRTPTYVCTHNIEESFRVKKLMMFKRVIEQERVKHYLPSQISHIMRGVGSAEGAQLHAVHNILAPAAAPAC
jgi:hypothetical protein